MKDKLIQIEEILSQIYCDLDESELATLISEVLQIIDDILCKLEDKS